MFALTEDKPPVPLIPDRELCDVRIGATDPALFFSIDLSSSCEVTVEFQEFNSASRCVLLLSPTDPRPSRHTAVWKCLSPEQVKTVTILPADPSYNVGVMYLAVRYVETSGNTFIRLKLTLREQYEAEWYSAANRALYSGTWLGCSYHGRGRCVYGVSPEVGEMESVKWSARSLRQGAETSSSSWKSHFKLPLDRSVVDSLRGDMNWSLLPLPAPSLEVYEGDWVCGKKEGCGIYQWGDRSYWGMWKAGVREGFGVLCSRDGYCYGGEWLNDKRHGTGRAFYPDGTQYQGEWKDDVRSGVGLFTYTNKVVISGSWEGDVLCSEVCADYADGSCYKGDWDHDCRHGNGHYSDPLGNTFEGKWHMDKRTGDGTLTYVNGVVCVATWEEDVRQGGTFTLPNGEVYIGDWDDDMYFRQGHGQCTYPNGDVFEGSWCNDKKHGFGKLIQAEKKCVYEGQWHQDRRHGIGMEESEEGIYHGEYQDDVRSGQGLHLGRQGSMYRGTWKDDNRIGFGISFDVEKNKAYKGLFLFGKPHGVGKSRTEEDVYEGTWCDGQRHGVGVTLLPNGDVVHGLWHCGVCQDGQVLYHHHNGDTYDGEWKKGLRCGKGTQRYVNGSIYVGEWLNDKPHGRGSFTNAQGATLVGEWCEGACMDVRGSLHFIDGSVYEGDICDGKPHGCGRLTYPDGTSFEGRFRNGIHVL